jgi:hypothetical protein
MKKKIIVVAYHMGRVGSSAVMGLLNIAGINVGRNELLTGPAPMNPKGFFETKIQNQFLARVFEGYYPGIHKPPDITFVEQQGRMFHKEYFQMVSDIYGNNYPIALKSQRFLTIPFLYELKDEFDIKIIRMHRNIDDHASSIKRVWGKHGSDLQKSKDIEFIKAWLAEWGMFVGDLIDDFNLKVLDINFEDIINHTEDSTKEIFSFINMRVPSLDGISKWVESTLVNRKAI